MLRTDAAASAEQACTALTPVLRPAQVARWVEVIAQLVEAVVGGGILGLRREGVGVGTDGDISTQALEYRTGGVDGGADHFWLAAVEQQRSHAQLRDRFGGLGHGRLHPAA